LALQPKETGPVGRWFDRLSKWLDRLSNWHFVAVLAGFWILAYVVLACVNLLITGHVNLRAIIPSGVVQTAGTTAFYAWGRGWEQHRSGKCRVPAACQNEAETTGIERHQENEETAPDHERSS
jgi:uncharacterized membrane protein